MTDTQPFMRADGTLASTAEQRRAWNIGTPIIIALCVAGVISCSWDGAGKSPDLLKMKMGAVQDKIAADAVLPMERKDHSKTYSRLGKAQFAKANELTRWAAFAAAESDQCDHVDLVGISDSATRKRIEWYVDCANKERFQITQQQAEAARIKYDPTVKPAEKNATPHLAVAEPRSARWKTFNEARAVVACKNLVESTMLDQGSFDADWGWDSEKDDRTGLVTIQQNFEAKNAFGGTISSRFSCVVNADEGGRITKLSIREPDGWRKLL